MLHKKDGILMKENKQKGITLIALVVTVVLLLILAAVAISLLKGQDGLFAKADNSAKRYTEESQNEEDRIQAILANADGNSNDPVTLTRGELAQIRDAISTLQDNYTELQNSITSLQNASPKIFADTSRVIATVVNETAYNTNARDVEYTATEDCCIMGSFRVYKGGHMYVTINNVQVGSYFNNVADRAITEPIQYYLKKGDTIKFNIDIGNNYLYDVKAYGLK